MLRSLTSVCLLLAASAASAHFPWLLTTDEAHPRLFFGESLDDRDYHLPDSVSDAEVWQDGIDAPAKRMEMSPLEEEGFVGLESDDPIEPRGRLRTSIDYGNYHGSKLVYNAQHYPAGNPESWPVPADDVPADEGAPLNAKLRVEGDRLVATVLWRGEPLAGASVSLSNEQGGDSVDAKADDAGQATFSTEAIHDGLNGLMVMHTDKEDKGELDGERYSAAMHILTVTFNYDSEAVGEVSALTPLPQAVASFGAAVSDGWLYVYGGHIGQAHDHSRENLSERFCRIRLDGGNGGDWEDLPPGPAFQGLPMVAHGGMLYRIGGLDARNASGEDEDLHSVDHFAAYDPETNQWEDLPSLPNPRSSHNAVVIGDTLYVVGGWALSGDSDGDWQAGALSYDLGKPGAEWVELSEPPFKRRALAVGHVDGRVAVVCGMTDEASLSKQVFFYDPSAEEWTEGPQFPGKAFHGFGLSAWNLDGTLYAGGMEGVLYRLDDDRAAWTKADEFQTGRFFHQLVPDGRGGLLAVAGASPESGHTATIERLDLVFSEAAAETPEAEQADHPAAEAAGTSEKSPHGGANASLPVDATVK